MSNHKNATHPKDTAKLGDSENLRPPHTHTKPLFYRKEIWSSPFNEKRKSPLVYLHSEFGNCYTSINKLVKKSDISYTITGVSTSYREDGKTIMNTDHVITRDVKPV